MSNECIYSCRLEDGRCVSGQGAVFKKNKTVILSSVFLLVCPLPDLLSFVLTKGAQLFFRFDYY